MDVDWLVEHRTTIAFYASSLDDMVSITSRFGNQSIMTKHLVGDPGWLDEAIKDHIEATSVNA